MNLARASGILLHPTSLPNGVLDARGLPFRRLARRRRAALVAGSAARAARGNHRLAVHVAVGVRRLAGAARRPRGDASPAPTRRSSARGTPTGSTTGSTTAARSRTRCASSANGSALRDYARERGVLLFGDMPIYVADGGADHRAHPRLFRVGEVAGVPPDSFSDTGQLWGNPLYDWTAMRADGYRWWIERLRRTFELVDLTRIDHFRGFVSYWAVPAGNTTARAGPLAARARPQSLPRARGGARRAAGRRRGSRRDHRAGDAAAARARAARDGRAPVRARERPDESAPAAEPPGAVGRLHRHARQRHDARLVGER